MRRDSEIGKAQVDWCVSSRNQANFPLETRRQSLTNASLALVQSRFRLDNACRLHLTIVNNI